MDIKEVRLVFLAIIIGTAIVVRLIPHVWGWGKERHRRRMVERSWGRKGYWAFVPEPLPERPHAPPPPRRIAFDRETQMAGMTADERRIFEATVSARGPVRIAVASRPKPKQIIITPEQARVIEEFVPDFPVPPGRWLYVSDWPEGWGDDE